LQDVAGVLRVILGVFEGQKLKINPHACRNLVACDIHKSLNFKEIQSSKEF
jgi:hypothetical protein